MSLLKNTILPLVRPFCGDFGVFQLARDIAESFPTEIFQPMQTLTRTMPILIDDELLPRFESKLTTTLAPVLHGSYANGWATRDGSYISSANRLIPEFSLHYAQNLNEHPALNTLRPFSSVLMHPGPIISLTGKGAYNYYHWMLEILPKWAILKKYFSPGVHVYASAKKAFQKTSLETLGIAKIIDADEHPIIRAKKIFAAAVPLPSGEPHPWAVNFIRALFLKNFKPTAISAFKNIFLSRQASAARRIENFPEVENWCVKNNFAVVTPEDLSPTEQISIFQNAEFIIAPHGAALTNLLFANPQARVIEIIGDDHAHPEPPCFWALSNILQLRHACLMAKSIPHQTKPHEKDYLVDLSRLDLMLEKLR